MVAGPKQHYGSHVFNLGELREWRTQIFPTLAAANAEAALAQARIIYVLDTQTAYFGRPGSWVPMGSTTSSGGGGLGTPVTEVSDPNDLEAEYTAFSLTILSSDDVADTITVDVTPPGVLDKVAPGDRLTVTGSSDNSAVPWLDGVYDIVALDTVTGVITLPSGTVPAVPNPPVSTYGTGEFEDQTFPASGSIAIVNPSPETGGPALYVYDGSVWDNHNTIDGRLIFADGSRAFAVLPATTQVDNPTDAQELIRWGYLTNLMNEILSGPHDLTDIDSTGPTTVFTFLSDDTYSFTAGDELVVAGHGPADGTHTINGVTITPGTPDTFEVEIDTDLAINDAAPSGTASLKRPGSGIATRADVTTVEGDLASHVADSGDPHSAAGYIKLADATSEANSAVAAHEADSGDPHAAAGYQTAAEVLATVSSEISTHNSDSSAHAAAFLAHNNDGAAHDGLIAQIQDFLLSSGDASTAGVILASQVVDPNAEFAEPIWRDPDTGFWNLRTASDQPVHGLAVVASELVEQYGDIPDVDFTTEGFTLPTAITGEFSSGQYVRFPGATLNGTTVFKIDRLDVSSGEFKTTPAPQAETNQVSALEVYSPLGQVILVGTLSIPSGENKLPATNVLRFDVDSDTVKLDLSQGDLDHVVAGWELVVTGSTDNDGTYVIQSVVQDANLVENSLVLSPNPETVLSGALVDSITVATKTVVFDAGEDLSDVAPGYILTLTGTAENDGRYTVDTVDDGTKTVTVVEGMPGADAGAVGTGTFVNEDGPALPGTQHPVVQTFAGPSAIQSIDVDDGFGEAVIEFPAATDLSSVLPGDIVDISGATDPLNDGSYEVSSVNDGADTVNLTITLAGADQAGSGGTVEITGERETADGTATIRKPLKTNNFDTSVSGDYGDKFYADDSDPEGYSKTPGAWRTGWQSSKDEFVVSIEEERDSRDTNSLADGAGITVDYLDSSTHTLTLTQNSTISSISNIPNGGEIRLVVEQDGTGGWTLSYPGAVEWPAQSAPTVTAAANAKDIVTFSNIDGVIYGSIVQDLG